MENSDNLLNILKSTELNFLIGAGASYVDNLNSFPLMLGLKESVINDQVIIEYYNYIKSLSTNIDNQYFLIVSIFDKYLFDSQSNIERFMSVINGIDLYITDIKLKSIIIQIQKRVKLTILKRIMESDISSVKHIYTDFYKGIKKLHEVNSKKGTTINIFTTNYDLMNEISMEELNIHFYSGFDGIVNRKFNLALYNYDYTESINSGKIKFDVKPFHVNLYKLHGSLSWEYKNGELYEKNPFLSSFVPEIIYPSIDKFDNTNLIVYFSSLLREFSNRIFKANSTLVVIGSSLGDDHINKIIENSLSIKSFTLIIFFFGGISEHELLKSKYSNYDNVIIYGNNYNFKKVASELNDLIEACKNE